MKKQLLELFQVYFVDRKTGRALGGGATARRIVLAALLLGSLGWVFFSVSARMGEAVLGNGVDWLYFAVMGLAAMAFGVFGTVFNTYASLYLPKDNELLMSLPVPPRTLVLSRMAGVYATSLLYSAWIWIPAMLAYWSLAATGTAPAPVTVAGVAACVLLTFVIALFVTVLSCLAGWVVAFIASHTKGKSFITALCGLLVLGLYWFAYFHLISAFEYASEHIAEAGVTVQSWFHCSWMLGMAAQGNLVALVFVTAIAASLAAACFFVLVGSFEHIVAAMGASTTKTRKKKSFNASSPRVALLKRELGHFTSRPTWMLNCGFGILLLPIAGIAALVMQDTLRSMLAEIALEMPGVEALVPVLLLAALATVVSTNAITCASVSLEGKSLWIAQSLPIDPWETLRAKATMAALLNGVAVLFAAFAVGIALGLDAWEVLLVAGGSVLYTLFHAYLGLTLDLRNANLAWTDDSIPVKRSMNTLLALIGGWAICCLIVLAGCFLCEPIGCAPVLLGLTALVAALTAALHHWLKTNGAARFATL